MNIIAFTINGRVISKKNSKQWIVRGRKKFLTPSDSYERFRMNTIAQLMDSFKFRAPRIDGKIHVSVHFYLKGNIDIDIDNAFTSILDILQDKNFPVIVNDKNVFSSQLLKTSNMAHFYTEIGIKSFEKGGE